MSRYGYWKPYVPVAQRRAKALRKMMDLRKKGQNIQPIEIEGRSITRTFWGQAWCTHLEQFGDYENRLPRGRTYVRNGSVCHLEILPGKVNAIVSGSEVYHVSITIGSLPESKWNDLRNRCAGQVGSLLELLGGKLSKNVMAVVTDRDHGLFPLPGEITFKCSCPDWAIMCKHVAAVLYGVGARLDEHPELLFLLRGVNHEELISARADLLVSPTGEQKTDRRRIAEDDLADVFGIELSEPAPRTPEPSEPEPRTQKPDRKTPRVTQPAQPPPSATPPRTTALPITGKAVARLRKRFDMSQGRFAKLLGISVPTLAKWEKTKTALTLRPAMQAAWNAAAGLTQQEAWEKIEENER